MIIIDEEGDLHLNVVEYDDSIKRAPGQPPVIRQDETFLINREVLLASSSVLRLKIGQDKASNKAGEFYTIEDDRTLRVRSIQIWLNVLHRNCFSEQAYNIDIGEIWHIAVRRPLLRSFTLLIPARRQRTNTSSTLS